jgi:hypothetical protein
MKERELGYYWPASCSFPLSVCHHSDLDYNFVFRFLIDRPTTGTVLEKRRTDLDGLA